MSKISLIIVLFGFSFTFVSFAKGVYQTSEQFINSIFAEKKPQVKVLWLSKEDKNVVAEILSHKYNRLRIRYWQHNNDTVWILNEIGKEKPITIGVHIRSIQGKHQIEKLKVLTFRESRGDEIRHDFFSDQFKKVTLNAQKRLTQHIDGITGATLSVRATTKVARLALWLNSKIFE
ncbi:MAG: FMN-binding protein [Colwellia sp.]